MSARFIPAPAARTGKQKRTIVPCLVAAALGLAAPAGPQQIDPQGPEFQVNTYTTNAQSYPAVAIDDQGNFIIVWQSSGSSGTDTSGESIQARRYDAYGAPLGAQFQVNTYTTSGQKRPAVAVNRQGDFIVAWESNGSSGTDTSFYSIQAQRYDANGAPLGGQFQVNTYTTSFQVAPAIAVNGQGNFAVAWESSGSSAGDINLRSVQTQLFDANGAPLGGQSQANSFTIDEQKRPAVAIDDQGRFIVAWEGYGLSGTDTSAFSIQAQRYDASAAPVGGNFQVNSYTLSRQDDPAVAVHAQGSFAVAWSSYGSGGNDNGTNNRSLQTQSYDENAAPLGGQVQVNTYTTGSQRRPSVAVDGQGNFVVAWESLGSSGTDTSDQSIQAQRLAADGAPLGGEFQVNTYTTSRQFFSKVAANSFADFVVTWQSLGSSGTDSSNYSVQAQRYGGLFHDGFESGGTSAWSATTP